MCGITGFLDRSISHDDADLTARVTRMMDSLQHRGPDDSGSWVDAREGIALGFRRLAILDLSPTGHQPMTSADGRYVIIFNGEVYNFSELHDELSAQGHHFRGTSDTEIMLAAICQWGMEKAVQRFNGMFAIAVWDRQESCLYLLRDRPGIKPLYYCQVGNIFLFGSELKALRAHPGFAAEIDRDALALYLRYSYIPAPYSIYKNVFKLPPATLLRLGSETQFSTPQLKPYWSAREVAENGTRLPLSDRDPELIDQLEGILKSAVQQRMIADVPLGAFLSGGIDSSTIVSLMQVQSSRPVKTFTIGFRESDYDEAAYAKAIASHLGTEHTELYVTPEEARSVIPCLPELYDEPFADASQIPTYLVSRLAREHVTVSLSGDGGDELFGGYNRYFWTKRIWSAVRWMPGNVRKTLGRWMTGLSGEGWQKANAVLPVPQRLPNFADKVSKLGEIFCAGSIESTYLRLISQWKQPERLVLQGTEPFSLPSRPEQWPPLPTITDRMMYLDLVTYLPDDILVKLDRASMGVSLEGRVPFLDDHRVIEFAWQLPLRAKVRDGKGKWILRQILHRYVPKQLIERPKMGFGVPIDSWLRGPLRAWAEALLDTEQIKKDGYLDPIPIRTKWAEHSSRRRNWQYPLWNVLMFQAWLQSRP